MKFGETPRVGANMRVDEQVGEALQVGANYASL